MEIYTTITRKISRYIIAWAKIFTFFSAQSSTFDYLHNTNNYLFHYDCVNTVCVLEYRETQPSLLVVFTSRSDKKFYELSFPSASTGLKIEIKTVAASF